MSQKLVFILYGIFDYIVTKVYQVWVFALPIKNRMFKIHFSGVLREKTVVV